MDENRNVSLKLLETIQTRWERALAPQLQQKTFKQLLKFVKKYKKLIFVYHCNTLNWFKISNVYHRRFYHFKQQWKVKLYGKLNLIGLKKWVIKVKIKVKTFDSAKN